MFVYKKIKNESVDNEFQVNIIIITNNGFYYYFFTTKCLFLTIL